MDGKMARARRENDEKFQHNNVSTKNGEERMRGRGSYLYPKRQSEGTWMNSKCQFHKKEQISS
jgi:hypothetical protein